MNLKPFAYAAAVSLVGLSAACSSNNKSNDSANADTVAVVDEATAAEAQFDPKVFPYTAEFFNNPERKGNGMDSTWAVTASGLKYAVIAQAEGAKPKAEDTVTVHYAGALTNGQQFDSSIDRGEPTSFPLNRVIKGWTEGLQLMSVGSTYEFYIPYDLGYGEQGQPQAGIPPFAPLMFRVELIKIGE